MNQSFTYKEQIQIWWFVAGACCLATAYWCFKHTYSIAFRNFEILPYPLSIYAMLAAGLGLAGYGAYKLKGALQSRAHGAPIQLQDTSLSFRKPSGASVTLDYGAVKEIRRTDDEEETLLVLVAHDGQVHEFDADNFQSVKDFETFEQLLRTRCQA